MSTRKRKKPKLLKHYVVEVRNDIRKEYLVPAESAEKALRPIEELVRDCRWRVIRADTRIHNVRRVKPPYKGSFIP